MTKNEESCDLSTHELNLTNLTVTGSFSNESDSVWVNGTEAYYTNGSGGWEADNVTVSPTGNSASTANAARALFHPQSTTSRPRILPANNCVAAVGT